MANTQYFFLCALYNILLYPQHNNITPGRFVLKGPIYNPMDVMNVLMCRRGYRMQGPPQQRTIPNTQNKDDK